ncbi:MAG: ATP-dependent helicase HrpB [Ilumatobacteraceae bacterium]
MRFTPPDLPVAEALPAVAGALADLGRAILVAPPGAGKTTLAPLMLLGVGGAEPDWLTGRRIVMLEPRRLATRAAAQRMAALLGEEVGQTVGYQTRDERRIGRSTRIEVVTEGVLTRRLQHDPTLDGVGLVIFDEVHERNLPTDLGLAFALDARRTVRPDLRVLLMTATPDTSSFRRVLGEDTPVLESDGRMHPVDIVWAPVTNASGGAGPAPRGKGGKGPRPTGPAAANRRIAEDVASLVQRALREQTGSVLVFLPGIGEIRRVQQLLEGNVPGDVDIRPLAGALSPSEQDAALAPSPAGRRRVVLSTDIAESSLTVDGVRVVVDSGMARVPRFDQRTGMSRLTTVSISRASADQRAGRAGRTEPGAAYRLWSKLEHGTRRTHLEAEITQVDLSGLMLEVLAWGTPITDLPWIDAPPKGALQQAADLLEMLGAVRDGTLTKSGRRMLDLPLHPRLARMVVDSPAPDLACVIATVLDERDILRGRPDELPVDLALRVGVVCGEQFATVDRREMYRLRERALDLARRADASLDLDRLDVYGRQCGWSAGAVLSLAYPDRLAVRRSQPGQYQLRSGAGAWMPADDLLADARFVIAADLDGRRDGARIRIAAALDADEVASLMTDQVERRVTLEWDSGRNGLVERVEMRLGGMLLDEQVYGARPGHATTVALLDHLRASRLAPLSWSTRAQSLRERVAFLRRTTTDGDTTWPDWGDEALIATLADWLGPYVDSATCAADLARVDLDMVLGAQFDWDTSSRLSELAPPTLTTANGREVPIDYSADVPTVHVRVQDMFGTTVHPCVAGGRVPLALALLSPADRPVQITRDLPGFWAGTWADVRKDMAGRYPKHQWPVDPANAPPHRLK